MSWITVKISGKVAECITSEDALTVQDGNKSGIALHILIVLVMHVVSPFHICAVLG